MTITATPHTLITGNTEANMPEAIVDRSRETLGKGPTGEIPVHTTILAGAPIIIITARKMNIVTMGIMAMATMGIMVKATMETMEITKTIIKEMAGTNKYRQ